jgi:DNA gyrase subunit A
MLFSDAGKVVRFSEDQVRPMGRTATGVRGIRLMENEKVVSLIVPEGDGDILTATENGFGKRTPIVEYPAKSRATKGVVSIKVSERNGLVVGAIQVDESKEIMLISDQGTLVRTRASEVSTVGRNTQGVRLIRTAEDEHVVGLQRIDEIEEAEFVEGDADGEQSDATEANLTADATTERSAKEDGSDDTSSSDDETE